MFVRLYQGGKSKPVAVPVMTQVLGVGDAVVSEKAETIDAARFDNAVRAADYAMPLDLKALQKGAYVATFKATLGKDTVRRDVRFTIR
jgi:hypothetical protein